MKQYPRVTPLAAILLAAITIAATPAVQAAGLLVGSHNTGGVLRFDESTGEFIDTFVPAKSGGLNWTQGLAIGPDGDLYVCNRYQHSILRYDGLTGAFRDTFVPSRSGGLAAPIDLVFGPDGDLYVASFDTDCILRFDGSTGASKGVFAAGGGLEGPRGMAFGPDGHLYAGSSQNDRVLRFDGRTGTFIDAFVPAGRGGLGQPNGLAFGPDANLYVSSLKTQSVLRYTLTGEFDTVFVATGEGGLDGPGALAFGADGNLYVVSTGTNSVLRFDGESAEFLDAVVARGTGGLDGPTGLVFGPEPGLPAPGDYLGTGRTQPSVFSTPTPEWRIQNASGGIIAVPFGLAGDLPVPADYRGLKRAQIAVYRPSTREWLIRGDDGNADRYRFGGPEDRPVPADYLGQGRAQMAVFRPGTAEWLIRKESGDPEVIQWGTAGDRPVPGDYLGLHRAQIAVFRPSSGEWYLRDDHGGATRVPFGSPADQPVPADYLGLGRVQMAVFRSRTAEWFLRTDAGKTVVVPWGAAGDRPVPYDFLGSGRAQIAVYRPSTGEWLIRKDDGSATRLKVALPGESSQSEEPLGPVTAAARPSAQFALTFSPSAVRGGATATGTITLQRAARAAGVVVKLVSDNPAVSVPATVTVKGNTMVATFTVTTMMVTTSTQATVAATLGILRQKAGLTIDPPAPPTAPSNLTVSVTSQTQLGLKWKDNSPDETTFQIERKSGSSAFARIKTLAAGASSFTDAGLLPGTGYTYRVRTTADGRLSAYSNEAGATTRPVGITSVTLLPTSLVGGGTASATVTLNAKAPAGGTLVTLASASAAATVAASIRVPAGNSTYDFTVTTRAVTVPTPAAISATLNGGSKSATLTLTAAPTSVLEAPTNLTATAVSPSGATLAWSDNCASETGFEVEQKSDSLPFSRIGTVGANARMFAVSGLNPNTRYTYRVRTIRTGSASAFSNEASTTTPVELIAQEFVGPFPSWKNVKTDFGAVGDGKADDTAAIQRALDDLRLHEKSCVLYFPSGTYRITATVKTTREMHTDCLGVSIIGEDPNTTIIRWDGPAGGIVFQYDAWYAKISRLTLDGAGKASEALHYGDSFSTYNETSDMIFKDAEQGLVMGGDDSSTTDKKRGQAENMVLRCRFIRCSKYGLYTNNWNSMDVWAWYCHFEECGYAMYNRCGNYHAYQCLFERSTIADAGSDALMVFSFVNNTSIGSNCFVDFRNGHTWGSPCSITGNRVIEPTGDWAIRLSNGGPYLVMDNVIRARAGVTKPVVEMTSRGDQTFLGNIYSVADPVLLAGKYRRIDEKVVAASTIDPTPPALPATPPNLHRRIFEVPVGSNAAAIQTILNAAAQLVGQRSVVHFPKGNYPIDHTLVVPSGSDLQMVGDGGAENATVLEWTGATSGPLLKLTGPSRAVVRDLYLLCERASGILIDNADQPGGQVYTAQLSVQGLGETAKPKTGLLVNGVEQADVTSLCLQGGGLCQQWVRVIGGSQQQVGAATAGQVGIYTGAASTSDLQYEVQRGGRLMVRSIYHEVSGNSSQAVRLTDRGALTVDATRFSYKTAPGEPVIQVDGFRGDLAITSGQLLGFGRTAQVGMTGDGSNARVLCLGNVFWANEIGVTSASIWTNTANPPAKAALLLCNTNSSLEGAKPFDRLTDQGTPDDTYVRSMLAPMRAARIGLPAAATVGVTGVQLQRVICSTGLDTLGVEVRAGSAP